MLIKLISLCLHQRYVPFLLHFSCVVSLHFFFFVAYIFTSALQTFGLEPAPAPERQQQRDNPALTVNRVITIINCVTCNGLDNRLADKFTSEQLTFSSCCHAHTRSQSPRQCSANDLCGSLGTGFHRRGADNNMRNNARYNARAALRCDSSLSPPLHRRPRFTRCV